MLGILKEYILSYIGISGKLFILLLLGVVGISIYLYIRRGPIPVAFVGLSTEKAPSILLLVVALICVVLVVPPIAAKGYDCPLFVFIADRIQKEGVDLAFRTDRPFQYIVTYVIGETFKLPGRLSVPLSAILFSMLFVMSTFALSHTLTKNTFVSAISSLFLVNSNIFRQLSLCFIGNLFGMVFLNMFFTFMLLRKPILMGVSFLLMFFSHPFTCVLALSISLFYCGYLFLQKELDKSLLLVCVLSCGLVFLLTLSPLYSNIVEKEAIYVGTRLAPNLSSINILTKDWNSDYLLIFLFALVGAYHVIRGNGQMSRFICIWIVISALPVLFFSYYGERLFLYFPFSVLCAIGVTNLFNRYAFRRHFIIFVLCLLVLCPYLYYSRMRHMNQRYFSDRVTFPWDTKFVEMYQLEYISKNYDMDHSVVIIDIELINFNTPINQSIKAGLTFRALSIIGNNIYFGNLTSLFTEEEDFRKYSGHNRYLGLYSSLNVDWTIENKTLILPSILYKISEHEKEITHCANEEYGIYIVDDLTEEEINQWIEEGR